MPESDTNQESLKLEQIKLYFLLVISSLSLITIVSLGVWMTFFNQTRNEDSAQSFNQIQVSKEKPAPKSPPASITQEIIKSTVENPSIQKELNKPLFEKSYLTIDDLKIESPIQWSSLEDLYQKNVDGSLNLNKPYESNGSQVTPIEKLLDRGVVHLAFTPLPGELGNSYIIGRNGLQKLNPTKFDLIFQNLDKAEKGQIIKIVNKDGKNLDFKIFQVLTIDESNVSEAYKDYKNQRVLTLQSNSTFDSSKRLLVRAELVSELTQESNLTEQNKSESTRLVTINPKSDLSLAYCNVTEVTAGEKLDCFFNIKSFKAQNKYILPTTGIQAELVVASRSGRSDTCKIFNVSFVLCTDIPTGSAQTNAINLSYSDIALFQGGDEAGYIVGRIKVNYSDK